MLFNMMAKTRNEIRANHNLAPVAGGDEIMQPLNMTQFVNQSNTTTEQDEP
jgi:hypothetical protein